MTGDGRPAVVLRHRRPLRRGAAPAAVRELLEGLAATGRVTAAEAVLMRADGRMAAATAGAARRPRGAEALFDLASLSKLWTASLALRLDGAGLLPLGLRLGELWPRCDRRLARRELADLLCHRSGLRAWTPLYRRCRTPATVARRLLDGGLLGARAGTYSDLGYVLWGLSAERALGRALGELLVRELAAPLGLLSRPPRERAGGWVACALDNEREAALAAAQGIAVARRGPPPPGRVQDGNARFLGAPAGHAGLFASAAAMAALGREWLRPGRLWPAAAVTRLLAGRGPWAFCWRRARRGGDGGAALGAWAYGHVGFTGGSMWIAPAHDRVLVLLAHRTATSVRLTADRRRFHAAALVGEPRRRRRRPS